MEKIDEIGAVPRSGALTAEALVDDSLERIARLEPFLNSFVALDEEGAETTRQNDAAEGGDGRSPLEGIPCRPRTTSSPEKMPAPRGSRGVADSVPGLRRIAGGAAEIGRRFLGKTNVLEFTLDEYTGNDMSGYAQSSEAGLDAGWIIWKCSSQYRSRVGFGCTWHGRWWPSASRLAYRFRWLEALDRAFTATLQFSLDRHRFRSDPEPGGDRSPRLLDSVFNAPDSRPTLAHWHGRAAHSVSFLSQNSRQPGGLEGCLPQRRALLICSHWTEWW